MKNGLAGLDHLIESAVDAVARMIAASLSRTDQDGATGIRCPAETTAAATWRRTLPLRRRLYRTASPCPACAAHPGNGKRALNLMRRRFTLFARHQPARHAAHTRLRARQVVWPKRSSPWYRSRNSGISGATACAWHWGREGRGARAGLARSRAGRLSRPAGGCGTAADVADADAMRSKPKQSAKVPSNVRSAPASARQRRCRSRTRQVVRAYVPP